jgi:hypothetical protein
MKEQDKFLCKDGVSTLGTVKASSGKLQEGSENFSRTVGFIPTHLGSWPLQVEAISTTKM